MFERHHRKKKRDHHFTKVAVLRLQCQLHFPWPKLVRLNARHLGNWEPQTQARKLEKSRPFLGLRCMTFGRMRNKLPSIVQRWSKGVNIVFKCQIPCKSSRPTHKSGPWDDSCKGFPTICETFGGWLQLTSRLQDLPISASQCYWAHGSVATFCSKSTLDLLVFQLQCYTGLMRCFERILNLLNLPWIVQSFLPTFVGDIKRDITVFSKQKNVYSVLLPCILDEEPI